MDGIGLGRFLWCGAINLRELVSPRCCQHPTSSRTSSGLLCLQVVELPDVDDGPGGAAADEDDDDAEEHHEHVHLLPQLPLRTKRL